MSRVLGRAFFARSALHVAPDLLGKILVRRLKGTRLSGRIVETEAYVGTADRACHASRGRTARTEVMFGPAGVAYVYLIYGMHHCLNIVTSVDGEPEAVLIRAIEPLEGLVAMKKLRNNPPRDRDIASGPGRLCAALAIDRRLNGTDFCGGQLYVEDDGCPAPDIAAGPRIGVEYAGEYAARPWRFFVESHPHVSRTRPNTLKPLSSNNRFGGDE